MEANNIFKEELQVAVDGFMKNNNFAVGWNVKNTGIRHLRFQGMSENFALPLTIKVSIKKILTCRLQRLKCNVSFLFHVQNLQKIACQGLMLLNPQLEIDFYEYKIGKNFLLPGCK